MDFILYIVSRINNYTFLWEWIMTIFMSWFIIINYSSLFTIDSDHLMMEINYKKFFINRWIDKIIRANAPYIVTIHYLLELYEYYSPDMKNFSSHNRFLMLSVHHVLSISILWYNYDNDIFNIFTILPHYMHYVCTILPFPMLRISYISIYLWCMCMFYYYYRYKHIYLHRIVFLHVLNMLEFGHTNRIIYMDSSMVLTFIIWPWFILSAILYYHHTKRNNNSVL